MGTQHTFHGPGVGKDFLGWRVSRQGATEIVYEDGAQHRMIWRVGGSYDEGEMVAAMQSAVLAQHVVPALMAELKNRAIAVERIAF